MDLTAIRKELGLTQAQFAALLGISNGYIGDIERDRRKVSLKLAAKLEEVTGRQGYVARVVAEKTGEAA